MSTEENTLGRTVQTGKLRHTLLEDWAAAWSSHDVEQLTSLLTDDCVYEDVTLGTVNQGKAQIKNFLHATFAAFPDFQIELAAHFVASNWAGAEWRMSGTHQGDFPGLPATGKSFSVRGASILELQEGKIRRFSDYWDLATFLQQVGLMPTPGQA